MLQITFATQKDVENINKLKIRADLYHFGPDYNARPLPKELTDHLIRQNGLLIAQFASAPTLAGFAAYDVWPPSKTLYLEQISVDPDFSRQGVASRLVERLVTLAKDKRLENIELTTNSEAMWSKGLYEKFGFLVIDEETLPMPAKETLQKERNHGMKNRVYMSLKI